jgi:hypothetical protein
VQLLGADFAELSEPTIAACEAECRRRDTTCGALTYFPALERCFLKSIDGWARVTTPGAYSIMLVDCQPPPRWVLEGGGGAVDVACALPALPAWLQCLSPPAGM